MRFTPFAFIGTEYPVLNVQYLIVGGGGGGGNYGGAFYHEAGAGGAGGFISGSGSIVLNPDLEYSVTIGAKGTGDSSSFDLRGINGGNSIFLGVTAYGGGGGGGTAAGQTDGGNGASGGGGGYFGRGTRVGNGGSAIYGSQGNAGGNAFYKFVDGFNLDVAESGMGGGAATTASNAGASGNTPIPSIEGQPKAWLDGFQYAGGGGNGTYASLSGSGGNPNTSYFQQDGTAGIVKLRYSGSTALLRGGEISISGGYVYHTFPSTSVLIAINQNQN